MLKIKGISRYCALSLAIALVGCSGNDSSTSIGSSPVVTPVKVKKEFTAVDWNTSNEAIMASHVYRSIAKNAFLSLGFAEDLGAIKTLFTYYRVNDNRSCKISGSMKSEQMGDVCFSDAEVTEIPCTVLDEDDSTKSIENPELVVTTNTQRSLASKCQDGVYIAKYFDGYFNFTDKDDISVNGELHGSTIFSAIGSVAVFDEQGDQKMNDDGDLLTEEITDYLYQTDSLAFFFDHEYDIYIDLEATPDTLSACTDGINQVLIQQGIRSPQVGAYEEKGAGGYDYNRLTNLDLKAVPIHTCDDSVLKRELEYSLTATIESAVIGGGDDNETTINWTNAFIPLIVGPGNYPKGEMTLVHQNSGTLSHTVTIDFDSSSGMVTVNRGLSGQTTFNSIADFLELSKPEVVE